MNDSDKERGRAAINVVCERDRVDAIHRALGVATRKHWPLISGGLGVAENLEQGSGYAAKYRAAFDELYALMQQAEGV